MELLSHMHGDRTDASEKTVGCPTTLKTVSDRRQKPEQTADVDWKQALANKVILGHIGRTVSIGRSNTCMLQIGSKATTISRRHAEIAHKGDDGGYELHVLGSNGVRVNGNLYMKDARLRLRAGDEINFVGIRFRFREPAAVPQEETEEWWPEPVRKRRAGEDGRVEKRIRVLTSEGAVLESSAETLVGGSEIGAFDASRKPMFAQQIIDCLPPSSPPPMSLFDDEDGEGHAADGPAFGLGDESLPEPTTSAFATQVFGEPKVPVQEQRPDSLPSAKKPAKQDSRTPSAASKENIKPCGAAGKENSASNKENAAAKPGKTAKTAKTPRAGKRHDDEMMASLRELLGIVDPSECLANAIDSETEALLTTKPEQPLSLPQGSSLVDLVVQTMVFSARTSHTISDLLRDMAHADGPEAQAWRHHLTWTLFHNKCFGRVERRVKDASDRRAEDKWYYDAARDDCDERRANFGGL
ncbi:hypothetical protein LPJ75_005800, partial [Coemansia sp. RSA 2598]